MRETAEQEGREQRLAAVAQAIEHDDLAPLRGLLAGLHPAEIANLLESLPPREREPVWHCVDVDVRGEVLTDLNDEVRAGLLGEMDTAELVETAGQLDVDDTVDLLQDLPYATTQRVLEAMDQQNRERVEAALAWPEESAGGLMNTDVVRIRADITLDVVLRYLRMRGELPAMTNRLMVVDRENSFLGTLRVADLVTHDETSLVADLMERDCAVIPATQSGREATRLFEDHDLISAPVLDERGRLLGRITVDDVVDLIREEAEHALMGRAGLMQDQDTFAPVAVSVRRRSLWLGVNLATAFLASWVIGLFEQALAQVIALAVLMPVVASMGGIAGGQTLTLVVRGMALGQIAEANIRWLIAKEALVGLFNGLIWACVVGVVAMLWFDSWAIGGVIAVAITINLAVAALAGVVIPVVQERLGVDPALAGHVALTTVTDVVGFASFLGLATLFLI